MFGSKVGVLYRGCVIKGCMGVGVKGEYLGMSL